MVTVDLPPSVNSRGAFTIEETFDVDDPVKVDLVFYKKNRTGDLDNRIKPVLDALTRAGVWEDDAIVADVAIKLVQPNKKLFPRGATFVEILEAGEKYGDGKELDEWTK